MSTPNQLKRQVAAHSRAYSRLVWGARDLPPDAPLEARKARTEQIAMHAAVVEALAEELCAVGYTENDLFARRATLRPVNRYDPANPCK